MTATEIQIQIESTKAEADRLQELLTERKRLSNLKAQLEGPESPLMALVIEVCIEFQITPEQIFHRKRSERIVVPRQIAMTLMRELTDMTLTEIGEYFARDHGTVINAMRKVSDFAVGNRHMHARICELRRRISQNCDLGKFSKGISPLHPHLTDK